MAKPHLFSKRSRCSPSRNPVRPADAAAFLDCYQLQRFPFPSAPSVPRNAPRCRERRCMSPPGAQAPCALRQPIRASLRRALHTILQDIMAYALGNRHASKPTDPATPINHYDYLWSHEAAAARDQDKIRQICSAATIRSFPPDSDCGCRMRPAGAKPSTTMRARSRSTRPASASRRAGEAMTGAAENTPRGGAGAGAEVLPGLGRTPAETAFPTRFGKGEGGIALLRLNGRRRRFLPNGRFCKPPSFWLRSIHGNSRLGDLEYGVSPTGRSDQASR